MQRKGSLPCAFLGSGITRTRITSCRCSAAACASRKCAQIFKAVILAGAIFACLTSTRLFGETILRWGTIPRGLKTTILPLRRSCIRTWLISITAHESPDHYGYELRGDTEYSKKSLRNMQYLAWFNGDPDSQHRSSLWYPFGPSIGELLRDYSLFTMPREKRIPVIGWMSKDCVLREASTFWWKFPNIFQCLVWGGANKTSLRRRMTLDAWVTLVTSKEPKRSICFTSRWRMAFSAALHD